MCQCQGKGCNDDEGTGASFLTGAAERAVTA